MMLRLFAALALVAAFGGAAPSAQSDLDSFMSQVLARRDENWKKLQQYTLAEDETFSLTGTGGTRIYGFKREYDWFPQDGIFVRSPTRADGVAMSDEERRRAEQRWIRQEQERDRQRDNEREDVEPSLNDLIDPEGQPRFVSSAYFMKFKFEPGHYALAGRERLLGREVLRIEYYPARLFEDKGKPPSDPTGARIQRSFNKVALITLWIEPAEHQILQYEFQNIDFDFLPGRSMARVDEITASMRMGEAFTGVWLPETIAMRFGMTLAIGSVAARYDVGYHDYKEAVTAARLVR
jgi:hypothetical protein